MEQADFMGSVRVTSVISKDWAAIFFVTDLIQEGIDGFRHL